MNWKIPATLLVTALMAGCNSADPDDDKQFVLTESQQKAYLADVKQPQQFGFTVFPGQGGSITLNGRARLHPLHVASANFVGGDAPVFKAGGKASRMKMHVLLDTSSPTSWMEYTTADEFEAIPLGVDGQVFPYQGRADTGGVNAFAAVVTQMRIDQLYIEDTPVFVRMAAKSLGPLNRGIYNPEIDGVFGYDLLVNFEYFRVDFMEGRIDFSATTPYTPNEDLLMTTAKIVPVANGALAVKGAISGEETPIVLDIAGNYHFANAAAEESVTGLVSLGEVVYIKVPTRLPLARNLPPSAGRLMLEKYIITVCPKKGVVYFERPFL